MPTFKKLPWVSLALLLVTYITVGRLLSFLHDSWFAWVTIVVGVVVLAAFLSSPGAKFRGSSHWLKADTKAFSLIIAGAFLSVLILWRLHVFVHMLIAISSATLVRLEAQIVRLSNRQTFWMIVIVSLAGLGLGAVLQALISFQS